LLSSDTIVPVTVLSCACIAGGSKRSISDKVKSNWKIFLIAVFLYLINKQFQI
jgi:hypothetical protein